MIQIKTTTERIESKGGLLLMGKIARNAGLMEIKSPDLKKAGTIIMSLFGLMAEGKTDFESMGEKRGSVFFKEALDLDTVYAKETVRLYLERSAKAPDALIGQLRESAAKIIRQGPLHGLWIDRRQYLPVDIDTTVLDNSKTKKEGVSWTYQGCEGYHPIVAYVGKEGYMLDCELRPGSQHCQKGTVPFIEGLIKQLKTIKAGGRLLFRLDSGNDSFETLRSISEAGKGNYCIIKRNNRKENADLWLKRAKRYGQRTVVRKGKKVWVGSITIRPQKKDRILKGFTCVFEVTERKIDREGNYLLIPEIAVNTWWTNLTCTAEKVISLYHDHATSEQFHSELKSDLGVERLPSGKLAVNKIVLGIAMNAYNALKVLGQLSLAEAGRRKFKRKRVGTVIRDLICVAGKLVKHARTLVFKLYAADPVVPLFMRLDKALDSS